MATDQVIKIMFEGREEFLHVIAGKGSIVKIMTDPSPVCPLMGTEIVMGNLLGQGMAGSVFEVTFPTVSGTKSTRKYAVKKQSGFAVLLHAGRDDKTTWLDLQKKYNIKAEKIIAYNKLTAKPTESIAGLTSVWIPTFMESCVLMRNKIVTRFDKKGKITFKPGDSMCPMVNSEFAISLLTGSLYRSGKSINFLDVFYFATCPDTIITDGSQVGQYTFMERVDTSVRKLNRCLGGLVFAKTPDGTPVKNPSGSLTKCSLGQNQGLAPPGILTTIATKLFGPLPTPFIMESTLNSIIIQTIHGMYTYQHTYSLIHGDLHDDNLFIEFVTPTMVWNNQRVIDADYFEYRVAVTAKTTKSIYIPYSPVIVKIGDWGYAGKYSTPRIVNKKVIDDGFDQYTGEGPLVPNFYNEVYDLYFMMYSLYLQHPCNALIRKIISWMVGVSPQDLDDQYIERNLVTKYNRPRMSAISSPQLDHATPKGVLLEPLIMKHYYKKPPKGSKIILMGDA